MFLLAISLSFFVSTCNYEPRLLSLDIFGESSPAPIPELLGDSKGFCGCIDILLASRGMNMFLVTVYSWWCLLSSMEVLMTLAWESSYWLMLGILLTFVMCRGWLSMLSSFFFMISANYSSSLIFSSSTSSFKLVTWQLILFVWGQPKFFGGLSSYASAMMSRGSWLIYYHPQISNYTRQAT